MKSHDFLKCSSHFFQKATILIFWKPPFPPKKTKVSNPQLPCPLRYKKHQITRAVRDGIPSASVEVLLDNIRYSGWGPPWTTILDIAVLSVANPPKHRVEPAECFRYGKLPSYKEAAQGLRGSILWSMLEQFWWFLSDWKPVWRISHCETYQWQTLKLSNSLAWDFLKISAGGGDLLWLLTTKIKIHSPSGQLPLPRK